MLKVSTRTSFRGNEGSPKHSGDPSQARDDVRGLIRGRKQLLPRFAPKFLLGISLLLLSSCGFHLRGLADIPDWLNNIAIIMNSGSRELEPLLKAQLKSYHVQVASSKTKASYWLVIENDSFQKQITNVSASTTPRQYLLLYTVQFSLIKNKGEILLASNTVSATRQFTLNNDRILGSDYEEMTFKREMEREAVSLIISRISAAQQNTNYAH